LLGNRLYLHNSAGSTTKQVRRHVNRPCSCRSHDATTTMPTAATILAMNGNESRASFACSSDGHHLLVRSSGSGHLNFFHKSLTKKSTRSAHSVEAVFGPCCRGELHWPRMSNNVFPMPRAALASRHSGPRRRPSPTGHVLKRA
jgi:hypothetical protein